MLLIIGTDCWRISHKVWKNLISKEILITKNSGVHNSDLQSFVVFRILFIILAIFKHAKPKQNLSAMVLFLFLKFSLRMEQWNLFCSREVIVVNKKRFSNNCSRSEIISKIFSFLSLKLTSNSFIKMLLLPRCSTTSKQTSFFFLTEWMISSSSFDWMKWIFHSCW